MKAMLSVNHPAWVHQFHHIVKMIGQEDGEVRVLAVEKDGDTTLLKSYNMPYVLCADTTGKSVKEKGKLFLRLCARYTKEALKFRPDVMIGRACPMLAIAAFICRRPHLVYEDTEVSKISLRVCKKLSTKILTPKTFLTDLGKCQERVDTYKELFYLHPDVFTPDKQILRDNGFDPDEKYILVRFVSWNANHDIGRHGLDDAGKIALVRRFEKYGRVYVSDEGTVPEELKANLLNIPYALVHHVLAFAQIVFSEGATMASEAVVLGTHALYINTIVSGSTKEQCERYHLLYNFNEGDDRYERAAQKAEELLSTPNLVEIGHQKQQILLSEKTNINAYYLAEAKRLAKAGRRGR